MSMAYAHDVSHSEDRYIDITEQAVGMLSGSVFPGAKLVNALPICACRDYQLVLTMRNLAYITQWALAGLAPGNWFQSICREVRPPDARDETKAV